MNALTSIYHAQQNSPQLSYGELDPERLNLQCIPSEVYILKSAGTLPHNCHSRQLQCVKTQALSHHPCISTFLSSVST